MGYRFPSSSSPPTRRMQFAGQIVGQRPQATHLGRPSACTSMTWVPRQRGESSRGSSGYWRVTFCGFTMCLKVSPIP
jgi:hypothetical protein